MAKRRLIGKITSATMHETATVTVNRMKVHALYGKRFLQSKTFAAHNPHNTYLLGETVVIEEHRPISKTKNWIIRERIAAAQVPEFVEDTAALVTEKTTPGEQ